MTNPLFASVAPPSPPGVVTLQRLDLVRLSTGQRIIVTGHNAGRPANPWSGVLENGHGKEYKFGYKHHPVKIGTVTEDHHALRANKGRRGDTSVVDLVVRLHINTMVDAVLAGDPKAKEYALILQKAGYGHQVQ